MKVLYGVIGLAVAAAVVFIIIGSNTGSAPANQPTSLITAPLPAAAVVNSLGKVPDLTFKDYSGKTVRLADFAGTPLVVNSWAAWCPFCRQELPDFAAAQKEFGDKVVIIAIDRQEDLATAKGYTDSQGTTNSLIFLLDSDDSFYRSIGGFSMPETIFVDKDGNIRDHKRGSMQLEEIKQRIRKIL